MSEANDQTLRILVELGVIGEKDLRAAKDLLEETGNAAGKDLSTSLPEGAAAWEKYKDVLKDTGREAGESHSQIRLITHTLREMGVEIPGLHLLLHAAFNPVTIGIVASIAAFELYKKRVEEMSEAMVGLKLPDLEPMTRHLTVAAEQARLFNAELKGILDKQNSIQAQTDKANAAEKANAELDKKGIEATKERKLAELEMHKPELTKEQYDRKKLLIEQDASAAVAAREAASDNRKNEQETLEASRLHTDAGKKAREAAGINIASASTDEKNKGERQKQADESRKSMAEAQEWINKIERMKDSMGEHAKNALPFAWRYGVNANFTDAIAIERAKIGRDRDIIDANDNADLRGPDRDALRKRREELTKEAAEEEGKARELDAQVAINRKLQQATENADKVLENSKATAALAATLPAAGNHTARILQIVEQLVAAHPQDIDARLNVLEKQMQAMPAQSR